MIVVCIQNVVTQKYSFDFFPFTIQTEKQDLKASDSLTEWKLAMWP